MSDTSYPVTVLVQRPDGTKEAVRVGTAVRAGDGFRLSLGELSIGATPDRAAAPSASPAPARRPAGPSAADGMVFPPYGRSKGAPIAGATVQDLEYYIQGSRRSLDDPTKARWHDKERVLLAAMESELARQRGGSAPSSSGTTSAPRAASAPRGQDFEDFGEPPPFVDEDDDIPF